MERILKFNDYQGTYAVFVNEDSVEKIGHKYHFKAFKGMIMEDAYDEADLHYGGKIKEVIPKGTEVIVNCWWMNFYGSYFVINYKGENYDIKTNKVKILK